MCIGDVLQSMPGAAWGAIGGLIGTAIGVAGTLGGTYLSNSSNDNRFEKQLEHDAKQKAKDRAAELRRPVYLNASDQIIAFNGFIGGLASMDASNKIALTSGFVEFMTAMSRVALVADEATRKKVAQLTSTYAPMFFQCLAEASTAHGLQSSIGANRFVYKRLDREQVRLLAAMRDANQNKESKVIFESVWKASESLKQQLKENAEEYTELTDKQTNALIEYGQLIAPKFAAVAELQAEVSALLRSELDLTVDLSQMKEEFNASSKAAKEAADIFYDKLNQMRKDDREEEAP